MKQQVVIFEEKTLSKILEKPDSCNREPGSWPKTLPLGPLRCETSIKEDSTSKPKTQNSSPTPNLSRLHHFPVPSSFHIHTDDTPIMAKVQALLIEDESPAARRLTRMLAEIDPDIDVIDTLESIKDAVAWLRNRQPDLIFLDIHLADGLSFSIFERVKVDSPIIFTTAYDQYAVRAFKLNSLDYLLKPVEREELAMALEKFRKRLLPPPIFDIEAILAALQPGPSFQQRFMVSSGEKIRSIPVEEVAYFFGQQKFVFLVTNDGRRHLIDHTLGQLEELVDPARFFRINRQFIVSFQAIRHMFPHSRSRIKIELEPVPDIEAVVSIEKSPKFREWIGQ